MLQSSTNLPGIMMSFSELEMRDMTIYGSGEQFSCSGQHTVAKVTNCNDIVIIVQKLRTISIKDRCVNITKYILSIESTCKLMYCI